MQQLYIQAVYFKDKPIQGYKCKTPSIDLWASSFCHHAQVLGKPISLTSSKALSPKNTNHQAQVFCKHLSSPLRTKKWPTYQKQFKKQRNVKKKN